MSFCKIYKNRENEKIKLVKSPCIESIDIDDSPIDEPPNNPKISKTNVKTNENKP